MTSLPPASTEPAEADERVEPGVGELRAIKLLLASIFLLLLGVCFYFARDFFLPVSLAFLFALVLGPVVRWLARRGLPAWATAGALVVILFFGLSSGAYFLSGPVAALISDAPRISLEVQKKLAVLRRPMEAINAATSGIEKLVQPSDGAGASVVVERSGLVGMIATGASTRLVEIGLCLVLVLFLLASGDLFYEKLIKVLPTLSDKKRALRIAREVEYEVSRYIFTITLINFGVGVVIATAFWLIGMPSPVLWGVMAALLNYLPYLGPGTGVVSSFAIGVVAFDTLGQAFLAPLAYLVLAIIEGQFVTPMIVGRRLELNAVVILIAIAFWGWMWGIVGALIAVPLLVTAKIFADHVDGLKGFGEFLAARETNGQADKDAAADR